MIEKERRDGRSKSPPNDLAQTSRRDRRGARRSDRGVRVAGRQPATYEADTRSPCHLASSDQGSQPTGDDAVFIARGYVERAGSNDGPERGRPAFRPGIPHRRRTGPRDRHAEPDSPSIKVTAAGPSAAMTGGLSDAVATMSRGRRGARPAAGARRSRSPRCATRSRSSRRPWRH